MKKKTNKFNFNKKLKNVVASILALFALMAVVSGILAIFDFSHTVPLLLAVTLHELGHILCAKILKIKISKLVLSPLGARLEIEDDVSYKNEFLIALSGPALGLVGFFLASTLIKKIPSVSSFAFISLALSIFNLLPLASLDGGRAAFCLLALALNIEISEKIMQFLSFFTLFAIWLFSVYVMLKFSSGLSAFVFCIIFFSKCFVFDIKKGDL